MRGLDLQKLQRTTSERYQGVHIKLEGKPGWNTSEHQKEERGKRKQKISERETSPS